MSHEGRAPRSNGLQPNSDGLQRPRFNAPGPGLSITAQDDIRAPSSHVGGNRHGPQAAARCDDLRLARGVLWLGVQQVEGH